MIECYFGSCFNRILVAAIAKYWQCIKDLLIIMVNFLLQRSSAYRAAREAKLALASRAPPSICASMTGRPNAGRFPPHRTCGRCEHRPRRGARQVSYRRPNRLLKPGLKGEKQSFQFCRISPCIRGGRSLFIVEGSRERSLAARRPTAAPGRPRRLAFAAQESRPCKHHRCRASRPLRKRFP
jgi:hypothetical protein